MDLHHCFRWPICFQFVVLQIIFCWPICFQFVCSVADNLLLAICFQFVCSVADNLLLTILSTWFNSRLPYWNNTRGGTECTFSLYILWSISKLLIFWCFRGFWKRSTALSRLVDSLALLYCKFCLKIWPHCFFFQFMYNNSMILNIFQQCFISF